MVRTVLGMNVCGIRRRMGSPAGTPSTTRTQLLTAASFRFMNSKHFRLGAAAGFGSLTLALSLLASISCSGVLSSRDDQERISGVYVLESVDGVQTPAPVSPQEGCSRTVRDGIMSISPGGSDLRPMYDWTIAITTDCQTVPASVDQGRDDVGTWNFSAASLALKSMKGLGAYNAVLEEASGNPPVVTFAYSGNSYRFARVMRFDDPQGVVYVKVVDQLGQPIAGVGLLFTFANGLESGGTTPDTGEYGTGGIVGECKITIIPPAGYGVPTTQANPFTVTIAEGPSLRIQVALTKN